MKNNKPDSFQFPLPFDPFRLILGIRYFWYWYLLLPLIFVVVGVIVGRKISDNRYSVSLQLLKAEVPNTIQTNTVGESFKPRSLSDETLVATSYATEVLTRTGKRLDPARSAQAIKGIVEIEKQRGTDFFYLTAHSRQSALDSIHAVQIWAEEIIRFTRRLQEKEAIEMGKFLTSQLDQINGHLKKINIQILEFSRVNEFFDEESQIESYVNSLEILERHLALARIKLKSKDIQVKNYLEEIKSQSPIMEEIKEKRKELTFLQGRYTDENPLVKEKLYEIRYLEKNLLDSKKSSKNELKEYTGTDLGNNLYLEILALQGERTELEQEVLQHEALITEKKKEFSNLPQKQLELSELKQKRQQLMIANNIISSRLKEAEFFISNAPGYWSIFQRPNINDVRSSSKSVKSAMLGGIGIIIGLGMALIMAAISEFRIRTVRTPLQASITTKSLPVLQYFSDDDVDCSRDMNEFWLTRITNVEPPHYSLLVSAVGNDTEEVTFWKSLFEVICKDEAKVVFVDMAERALSIDLAELSVENFSYKNISIVDATNLTPGKIMEKLNQISDDSYIIARCGNNVKTPMLPILRKFDDYYFLTTPSRNINKKLKEDCRIMITLLGPAAGNILVDKQSKSFTFRSLASLEISLIQWMSDHSSTKEG